MLSLLFILALGDLGVAEGFVIDNAVRYAKQMETALPMAQGDERRQGQRYEADSMLSKARQLRLEIEEETTRSRSREKLGSVRRVASPWLVENEDEGQDYRLYIDIGREQGTWMDRRWGASGRRIPVSIDVRFLSTVASGQEADGIVKDNFRGQSSQLCKLASAECARLRDGFERMNCYSGCYRIDVARGAVHCAVLSRS